MKTKRYATGGQLTKSINKSFYPTNYSVPMLGFGDFLKDAGMLWGDFMLSQFGGQNLIQDDAYNSNFFKKASKVVEPIGQIGGQIAGNLIAPGIGGQVMGGVQQGVSSAVPMDNSGNAATNLNMVEQQKKQMLMNDYVFANGGKFPEKNERGLSLVKDTQGNALLDNNSNPVYHPQAGTAKLSMSPIDAVVAGKTIAGQQLLRWAGANIIGNSMADLSNSLPEGITSAVANIPNISASEDLKRIGGFNDFKQSKQYLKEGKLGKSAWNALTGIGGVYDSEKWTPNWKYDDILDKGLEYMNVAGDSYDAMKGLTELKADGGMLPSYKGSNFTQPDNVTVYAEGGSHETNPNGGIPLGNKALVEQGEVRYNSKKHGDYIFSNRF